VLQLAETVKSVAGQMGVAVEIDHVPDPPHYVEELAIKVKLISSQRAIVKPHVTR
jgi:hypothetical protein